MKKFVAVMTAAAMLTSLSACGASASTASSAAESTASSAAADSTTGSAADATTYKVAIVQQLDHASLDEIRTAIEAELDAKAAEKGITIEYKDFNGQNDATTLNQIGTQVVSDGVRRHHSHRHAGRPVHGHRLPSPPRPRSSTPPSRDPAAADLTDIDYVTGTSDALNTQSIMDMIFAVQPDVQDRRPALLQLRGQLHHPHRRGQGLPGCQGHRLRGKDRQHQRRDHRPPPTPWSGQVDAVFTPTDNVVMAAAAAVSETLTKAGIPFYTGADSFVTAGAFATCGVNYTELGTYTADMALDILETGTVPEYHVMDGGIITVNTETAAALGLDYSAFNDLAGTVGRS